MVGLKGEEGETKLGLAFLKFYPIAKELKFGFAVDLVLFLRKSDLWSLVPLSFSSFCFFTMSFLLRQAIRRAAGHSPPSMQLYRNASVMLGVGSSVGTVVTLCEEEKSILDSLTLQKNKEGNVDWNATLDQVATAVGSKVQGAVETGVPTQLSYGFISGYCSGMALKKAGKVAAAVLGLGFMSLQSLSYAGYIQVDHSKMKKEVENMMDLNNDGKIDAADGQVAYGKVTKVLEHNLPSGAGFGVGFLAGLRSG